MQIILTPICITIRNSENITAKTKQKHPLPWMQTEIYVNIRVEYWAIHYYDETREATLLHL